MQLISGTAWAKAAAIGLESVGSAFCRARKRARVILASIWRWLDCAALLDRRSEAGSLWDRHCQYWASVLLIVPVERNPDPQVRFKEILGNELSVLYIGNYPSIRE